MITGNISARINGNERILNVISTYINNSGMHSIYQK